MKKLTQNDCEIGMLLVSFLDYICNNDCVAFWGTLSNETRGFLKGYWHKCYETASIYDLEKLISEGDFLKDSLAQEVNYFKTVLWQDRNDKNFYIGRIEYHDEYFAEVYVTTDEKVKDLNKKGGIRYVGLLTVPGIIISVIFELGQWKVNYLKTLQRLEESRRVNATQT